MADNGIELTQSIKQKNPVPASVWDVRKDFFGTGDISPEDAEILIANSGKWAHEGKRFYDKQSKSVYVITGISIDPLKWETKLLGDNITYDQIQIINKFSEILGDPYYNGKKLLTDESIPTDVGYVFIVPDQSSQLRHLTFNLGNLNSTGWTSVPSGVYVLTAAGEIFLGTPFQRNSGGPTYRLVISHTQKDGLISQIMHVYTDDNIPGNNNSIYSRVGNHISDWTKLMDEETVDAKIQSSSSSNDSAHAHKLRVLNIEELLTTYDSLNPEWGIPQAERTHGKVIWVKNYDEENIEDVSSGIGQLLVFKGWDLVSDWADLSNWEKILSGSSNGGTYISEKTVDMTGKTSLDIEASEFSNPIMATPKLVQFIYRHYEIKLQFELIENGGIRIIDDQEFTDLTVRLTHDLATNGAGIKTVNITTDSPMVLEPSDFVPAQSGVPTLVEFIYNYSTIQLPFTVNELTGAITVDNSEPYINLTIKRS